MYIASYDSNGGLISMYVAQCYPNDRLIVMCVACNDFYLYKWPSYTRISICCIIWFKWPSYLHSGISCKTISLYWIRDQHIIHWHDTDWYKICTVISWRGEYHSPVIFVQVILYTKNHFVTKPITIDISENTLLFVTLSFHFIYLFISNEIMVPCIWCVVTPVQIVVILRSFNMMTPSYGNVFCVTGLLWGESGGFTTGFPSQRPVARSFFVFFDMSEQRWTNSGVTIDLRHHGDHVTSP